MKEQEAEKPRTDIRHIPVAAEDDGQRLDRWLKKRVPELPYALAQKLVRKGAIRVDGKKASRDTRLAAGQEIRIPPVEDKPVKKLGMKRFDDDADLLKLMVLYDDGDVVVLNKPAGLATQGGSGVERHIDGLLELLADQKGRRPRLIHRLDRETSGVLLCARRSETVRLLGKTFHDRAAQKVYWAIVTPAPGDNEGTVIAPLAKGTGPAKDRMYVSEDEEAKYAATDFLVVERAAKRAAFMAFMPRTGRTHQIRVHTADVLESPILGDDKYGGAEATIETMDVAGRLHLHARRLRLFNPATESVLDIKAPLPEELVKSWQAFGFDTGEADRICERHWHLNQL